MDLGAITANTTVLSKFLDSAERHMDLVALRRRRDDGRFETWTYREYVERVARCAAGLRALGFGPGQRLVMLLRNRPEFHVLDMAAMFCGGTPVSIYNSSSPEQIDYLTNHAEATIAVADDQALLQRFLDIRPQLPTLEHIGVLGNHIPGDVFGWESLLAHDAMDLASAAGAVKPEELARLIYTSGTTGPSKAVMLTHKNIVSSVASMELLFQSHPRLSQPAGLRALSYLPMAHIAERATSHYFASLRGAEVTCCPEPTQLPSYLREVRPHYVFGVPRVWEKLYAGIQATVAADAKRAAQLKEAVDAALPLAEKIHAGSASAREHERYRALEDGGFKSLRAMVGLDKRSWPSRAQPLWRVSCSCGFARSACPSVSSTV